MMGKAQPSTVAGVYSMKNDMYNFNDYISDMNDALNNNKDIHIEDIKIYQTK